MAAAAVAKTGSSKKRERCKSCHLSLHCNRTNYVRQNISLCLPSITGCKELWTGLIGNTMCEICRCGVTVKTHSNKYFYRVLCIVHCALWYLSFCLDGKFVFLMCRLYLSSYCVECICLPICKCICLRPTWPRRTKREICRRRSVGSQFE